MAEPFALQFRGELAARCSDDAARTRDLHAAADLFRRLDCGARAAAIEQRLAEETDG